MCSARLRQMHPLCCLVWLSSHVSLSHPRGLRKKLGMCEHPSFFCDYVKILVYRMACLKHQQWLIRNSVFITNKKWINHANGWQTKHPLSYLAHTVSSYQWIKRYLPLPHNHLETHQLEQPMVCLALA